MPAGRRLQLGDLKPGTRFRAIPGGQPAKLIRLSPGAATVEYEHLPASIGRTTISLATEVEVLE